MNVRLTPELEQLVHEKVQSGRYASASEMVREALRQLEQKDEQRERQLQAIRGRIDESLAQADQGHCVDGEAFMQELIDSVSNKDPKRKVG